MKTIEAILVGIAIFFLFPIASFVHWLSHKLVDLTVAAVNHLDEIKFSDNY